MSTDHILALLLNERDKLEAAIAALRGAEKQGDARPQAAIATGPVEVTAPKKRHVSAAARLRMAEGQIKRWAAIKAAK